MEGPLKRIIVEIENWGIRHREKVMMGCNSVINIGSRYLLMSTLPLCCLNIFR
jgi:hypothetical protein